MSSLSLKLMEKYLEGKRLKGQSMGRIFSRMDGFLWPSARSPWWVTGEKVLSQLWATSNCSGPFRRRQVDGAYIHSVESSLEAEAPSHEATRLTERNHAKRRTPREGEIHRWLKTFLSLARERIVIWLSCAKSKGFRKMYFPRNNLKRCIGWQHDIWTEMKVDLRDLCLHEVPPAPHKWVASTNITEMEHFVLWQREAHPLYVRYVKQCV